MNNIFFCDYITNTFSFFSEEERREEAHAGGMAYSSSAPIPLYKEQGQQKTTLNEVARDRRDALHKATKKLPNF